jgi:coproporphyrinogen III oxidase
MKKLFHNYIIELQDRISSKLEEVDGKGQFHEDAWERPGGGGGRTRVLEDGNVFEKAGVNISAINGSLPESLKEQFKVDEGDFFACGLSIVIHPKNPFAPTVHANWRYFEMYNTEGEIVRQWFGGGQDLTPYYFFKDDVIHFHKNCKKVCDKYSSDFYNEFKQSCDEYFWNTHRNESRGVGGLFFDYLKETNEFSIQDRFDFVCEVGNNFLESYLPILNIRKHTLFSEENKLWQEIRRGRYVEFNLVHDRGTLFGLKTKGRIESILMSLPPKVQWRYDYSPEIGSKEAELLDILSKPINWLET